MKLPDGIKLTPMLEQYIRWKDIYPDCLLFFRMGDFYEMFFEDAKTASAVLDITLTSRSKDAENQIPMAGVPFHAVDSYLGRLVAAGFRVAICEQITEPDGRTLVEREVTRVVTPGTWLSESADGDGKIAACLFDGKNVSVALLESASGTLRAGTFPVEGGSAVLSAFAPDEVLIWRGQRDTFFKNLPFLAGRSVVEREKGDFSRDAGASWLCRKWQISSLSAMGVDDMDPAAGAAAAALKYLEETQFSMATHISSLTPILPKENLIMDQSTQFNLELAGQGTGSLFHVLNRCRTPMGRRLLKEWITSPLQDLEEIAKRQDAIEGLLSDAKLRSRLGCLLSACRDVGKSLSRLTLKMGSPQDVQNIGVTLNKFPEIKAAACELPPLGIFAPCCDISDLAELLSSAVADTVPRFVRDGGVIKKGFDPELDEWRSKASNSSSWLSSFEESERARSGIKNLKAGVNKVFGYYIEIPKGSVDKAPPDYVRKQTLVNAERFITDELKKFEREMFSAEDEIQAIEERIYSGLVEGILSRSHDIQTVSSFIAEADVLLSLAAVASERGYVRPEMDMSKDFVIKNARHPVIEVALGKDPFTPNDFNFSDENGRRIALITGPNMAGKSTYLRTAALIAVMAHMGSFVPAESAKIGLVDRVFTRIGARDELARGRSTFMVEMVETANILRHATDRSLVILDEVGRGTSTYDGLSIAWSVVEFLHGQEHSRPRVLFATHYHELTQLADILPGIVNLSMSVDESGGRIVFLHKIVEAPSDRSYGIEVARLAGVPSAVLKRSQELLEQFEERGAGKNESVRNSQQNQLTLFDVRQEAILEELAACDPNNMTPLAALEFVARLREESRRALDFQ